MISESLPKRNRQKHKKPDGYCLSSEIDFSSFEKSVMLQAVQKEPSKEDESAEPDEEGKRYAKPRQ